MTPNIRIRQRPSLAASPRPIIEDTARNSFADLRLQLEHLAADSLKAPARELRKHGKQQVEQIAASIQKHGNLHPLVIDADNVVVAGVGRLKAAKLLQLEVVPAIRASHLSPDELRLFALADNKLAECSSWDAELLKVELHELSVIPGLEIELAGFTSLEIENIALDGAATLADESEQEEIEEPDDAEPVSRVGDIFIIGEHRLICGNARHAETYERLLDGEVARMVMADLPYNVKIANNVSGLGKKRHGEFVEGSGEFSRAEFIQFKSDIFANLVAHSMDGSIHFQCMDWRHQIEMMTAGERHYDELKNVLVWAKTSAGMSAFYRSQHEFIYAWKKGKAAHVNNFGLGGGGRYRSNLLQYPGCNTFRKGRAEDLEAHSTVKPTALIADLIRDVSNLGDIVLDPTSGSGTVILAAERVKRRARCIELDPKYVDVTIRRAKARLGLDAVHAATGMTFEELAATRASANGENA